MTPETAVERAVLAEMRLKHITEAFECYINATTTPLNGYDERREPRLASQEAITDARIAVEVYGRAR